MDSDLLLEKENEYRKENEELELHTKMLLEKVENVMKQEQFVINESIKVTTKDLNLPKSVDEMGSKAMIQFYKAKLKTYQQDFQKQQIELKQKSSDFKKIVKENQTLCEEKEKWFQQFNIKKSHCMKLEKQIEAMSSKLQIKDDEYLSLKKENEQLRIELKNFTNHLNALEAKLNRLNQENENITCALKNITREEKEAREIYKKELKEKNNIIQILQKHKNELLNGYKKQIQLLDNLKRQKIFLQNLKLSEMVESDVVKLLDWKEK